ncbi:MAG: hypothetical protein AAFY52_02270 [Pseudomonadota bacterium]
MHLSHFSIVILALVAVAGCDDIETSSDADARADARGNRSCIRAVNRETGITGATVNATLPVVEVNQYAINAGDGTRYICYTNDLQSAQLLVKLPPEPDA